MCDIKFSAVGAQLGIKFLAILSGVQMPRVCLGGGGGVPFIFTVRNNQEQSHFNGMKLEQTQSVVINQIS